MIETKHMMKVTTPVSEWCSDHASPTGSLSRVRALDGIKLSASSLSLPYSEEQPWKAMGWSHILLTIFQSICAIILPTGNTLTSAWFQTLMISPFQVKKKRKEKSRRDFKSVSVSGLRRSRVPGGNIKGSHEASLRAQCLMLGGLREASWPAPVCSEMLPFVGDHVPSCRWAEAVLQWMVRG